MLHPDAQSAALEDPPALPPGSVRMYGVSRRFRIVHERNPTLKEVLIRRRRSTHTELWALRDVDLTIDAGESIGIVGRNGSGKSTLLKVLAGIVPPHSGTLTTVGSLASLLELGSGFHPDFTGRENVFMNGALHGLSQRDVRDRIDEIIDFSEVSDFIDMPVRTYSSGMQMRLAFAVASHVNPDILLLDEVLAVGDEAFQRKCMGRIAAFRRGGGTLVFVSHDPNAVEQVCTRAVLVDRGRIVEDASPSEIVRLYHRELASTPGRTGSADLEAETPPPTALVLEVGGDDLVGEPGPVDETTPVDDDQEDAADHPSPLGGWGTGDASIECITLIGPDGETHSLVSGDRLAIHLEVRSETAIPRPIIGVGIHSAFDGKVLYGSNTQLAGLDTGTLVGRSTFQFVIPALHLHEGQFTVSASVLADEGDRVFHWLEDAASFNVLSRVPGAGTVALDGEWCLDG